jgi:3-oxoacyl-[acyl-carrier-protein] synthase I
LIPLLLTDITATSCIGRGLAQTLESLRAARGGLMPCRFETVTLTTCVGEVADVDAVRLPAALRRFDCRNNRLALLGLMQDDFIHSVERCARRWGPRRVGVFLGTSTAGILETELAYRRRDPLSGALPAQLDYAGSHDAFSLVDFVRRLLSLEGPAAAISSACSSSAKVFGSARRLITAGVIDAALVGGVDSLCLTTLYGFHALQLTAQTPCRPFDAARSGISIGEAAAFALLERAPAAAQTPADAAVPATRQAAEPASAAAPVWLLGVGESSDAYHMSSPHPQGLGALGAMQAALDAAGLTPGAIDYINLHGTGTRSNDSAEAAAVQALFGADTPCSSTKGATGHTLGAAGALEAVICVLALRHAFIPGGLNFQQLDPQMHIDYRDHNVDASLRYVLSNSFGFGGSNCALIFGLTGTALS